MSVRYDDTGRVCARGPQPGTVSLERIILAAFPGTASAGIYNCRSVVGGSSLSLHAEGRATDIRPASPSQGDAIARWAVANASTYQIQEVIWYRRIWTSRRASDGWRTYTGVNAHTDHLHIGQNRDGARVAMADDGVDVGAALLVAAVFGGLLWWTWE